MALVTLTGNMLDPVSNTTAYFFITYDDITFEADSVRVDNQTPKTARVTVYPPGGGSSFFNFGPNTDTTKNLPANGRYNLDTWGYSYSLI